MLSLWRVEFDRLANLDPPTARAAPVGEMLRHYRRMAAALAAMEASDDESVLADVAAVAVEGTRGSRSARRAGLSACAFFPDIKQPPKDPEMLFDATRALVPSQTRVVRADKRDCNHGTSCLFELKGSGPATARLRAAVATLRAKGWTDIHTGRSPTGSSWATAHRNDYEVEIEFISERTPNYCTGRQSGGFGCTDSIWVHRVNVPDALTDS
jgi:hypothetical protein